MDESQFKVRGEHGEGWTSCSCGERSPVLPSAEKRLEWWEAHRQAVLGGDDERVSAPVDAIS